MIDVEAVKRQANLLALAGSVSTLRRVASTEGGEYAGPCPICPDHGRDRFRVQPEHKPYPRWMCHHCTGGKWQDAIELGRQLWPGLPFAEVCERLSGGNVPITNKRPEPAPAAPAYEPPCQDWQEQTRQALVTLRANLWKPIGKAALDYLHARGLRDETITFFGLGYSPGAHFGDLFIPRGLAIPCVVSGEVWYLKVRYLPNTPCKCQTCKAELPGPGTCPSCGKVTKYAGVKGNRTNAIYNVDQVDPASWVLFTEGEIDTMTAWQECIPSVTLGSATNLPDLATWGAYLLGLKTIYAIYDSDSAGQKGAARLVDLLPGVKACSLPEGAKDINEYYLAGGDLWRWMAAHLPTCTITDIPEENRAAMGL